MPGTKEQDSKRRKKRLKAVGIAAAVILSLLAIGGAVAASVVYTGSFAALGATLAAFFVSIVPFLPWIGIAVAAVAAVALITLAAVVIARRVKANKAKKLAAQRKLETAEAVEPTVEKATKKSRLKAVGIAAAVILSLLAIGGAVAASVFYTGSFAALGATLATFFMPIVPFLPWIGIAVAAVAAVALITVAAVAIARRVKANKAKKLAAEQAKLEDAVTKAQEAVQAEIAALSTVAAVDAYRDAWNDESDDTRLPVKTTLISAMDAAGYDEDKKETCVELYARIPFQDRMIALQGEMLDLDATKLNQQAAQITELTEKVEAADEVLAQTRTQADQALQAVRRDADAAREQAHRATQETQGVRQAFFNILDAKIRAPYQGMERLVNACNSVEALQALSSRCGEKDIQGLFTEFDHWNAMIDLLSELCQKEAFDPAQSQFDRLIANRIKALPPRPPAVVVNREERQSDAANAANDPQLGADGKPVLKLSTNS